MNTSSHQVDRLSKLVNDMLDISRISHGKMILEKQVVDLGALVKGVVDSFADHFLSANCKCSVKVDEVVRGYWDCHRIEQVMTNLITNSIKYGAGNPFEISVFTARQQAVIEVKDFGFGIAMESLEKVFDRFERAAAEKGISGLGLGLYISRQIIASHGGEIRVISELGKGSTFIVELPLAKLP